MKQTEPALKKMYLRTFMNGRIIGPDTSKIELKCKRFSPSKNLRIRKGRTRINKGERRRRERRRMIARKDTYSNYLDLLGAGDGVRVQVSQRENEKNRVSRKRSSSSYIFYLDPKSISFPKVCLLEILGHKHHLSNFKVWVGTWVILIFKLKVGSSLNNGNFMSNCNG